MLFTHTCLTCPTKDQVAGLTLTAAAKLSSSDKYPACSAVPNVDTVWFGNVSTKLKGAREPAPTAVRSTSSMAMLSQPGTKISKSMHVVAFTLHILPWTSFAFQLTADICHDWLRLAAGEAEGVEQTAAQAGEPIHKGRRRARKPCLHKLQQMATNCSQDERH